MKNLHARSFSSGLILFAFIGYVTGQAQMPDNTKQFRIGLTSDVNAMSDEAMMYFEAGLPAYDSFDVIKTPFGANGAPMIMTQSTDGANLMMNSFGSVNQNEIIPLKVKPAGTGMHHMYFYDGPGYLGATCVKIEDLLTGQVVTVLEGDTFSFSMNANDPVDPARFQLHISTSNAAASTDVSCFGMSDGAIQILGGGMGPWSYSWYGPGGVFIQTMPGHNGVSKLDNAPAGIYTIEIVNSQNCGVKTSFVEIGSPDEITANFSITDDDCYQPGTGEINASPTGGVPPFTYLWNDGGSSATLSGISQGEYSVHVFDSTGCSNFFPAISVEQEGAPDAEIQASDVHVSVNQPVSFSNMGGTADDYKWDFGDGTISTAADPIHSYALPGKYLVRLDVSNSSCSDRAGLEIEVGANGIVDVGPFSDVSAQYNNGSIQLTGSEYVLKNSTIAVVDALGRTVLAHQPIASNRTFQLNGYGTGVYRVILMNPVGRRALPITVLE